MRHEKTFFRISCLVFLISCLLLGCGVKSDLERPGGGHMRTYPVK